MKTRPLLPLALLLLASCSSVPPVKSPPGHPAPSPGAGPAPDVSAVPNAIPRSEPRSAHGNPPWYEVAGRRYVVLSSAEGYRERGVASWYGPTFHGKNTSSGEPYDMYGMTAAHKTLPLPCYARVTNLANGLSIVVRINDRGPFVANRLIDLSYTAAAKLDLIRSGTAFVEVETVTAGPAATTVTATAASPAASPAPTAAAAAAAVASITRNAAVQYVQVGAYSDPANAERMSARLSAAGLTPTITRTTGPDGGLLLRVRVGPVADVTAYDALQTRLESLGIQGARLIGDLSDNKPEP